MGALTDVADFQARLLERPQPCPITIATLNVSAGRPSDLWTVNNPTVGAAPSTAVVPTSATAGALGQLDGGTGRLSIIGAKWGTLALGSLIIADRLSHQGGLSGIVTTAQTTNLPTAALTRYTTGEGVMLGLSVYTAVGATATTVTASYTNSDGTSGRTTPAVAFGGTNFGTAAGRLILLPLQSGDRGVRSVESVTVAATTGTAGNFGVVLFKPLVSINVDCADQYSSTPSDMISGRLAGLAPEVLDGACLFGICITNAASYKGSGHLILSEV